SDRSPRWASRSKTWRAAWWIFPTGARARRSISAGSMAKTILTTGTRSRAASPDGRHFRSPSPVGLRPLEHLLDLVNHHKTVAVQLEANPSLSVNDEQGRNAGEVVFGPNVGNLCFQHD